MICPFCGSSDIHGPSRMTADWRETAGSPLDRQWYLPADQAGFMACGRCLEEFDASNWFGATSRMIVVSTAA